MYSIPLLREKVECGYVRFLCKLLRLFCLFDTYFMQIDEYIVMFMFIIRGFGVVLLGFLERCDVCEKG